MDISVTLYALIAFGLGAFCPFAAVGFAANHNRRVEGPRNDDIPCPSPNAMAWHVVHLRDDVGWIRTLLGLTNRFLAALVGILRSSPEYHQDRRRNCGKGSGRE